MLTTLAVALSLTVPYLPQTDALCGGAAAAMVFRYWGDAHADIEPFAPLVDKRAGGIADDVLIRAIEERGWRPRRFVGSASLLAEQIAQGRPVVILLADRGPVNHYLVVTGVDADAVIVHDPTWGPGRRISFTELMRLWRPTNFWALEILPSPEKGSGVFSTTALTEKTPDPFSAPAEPSVRSCDRRLNDAIDLAGARPADAFEILKAVQLQCPADAGPYREMAGVRFSERRWRDAADLAERAVSLDPHDAFAWELLASSRYVQDDLAGALRAWNAIGKPLVNLVQIEGLAHARFQTIATILGLQPNQLLTERAFRLATRRLQELPDRTSARLSFRPESDGFVTVTAAIAERRGPPRSAIDWTAAAAQAAIDREARVGIPGTTGQGELWYASWRWWDRRPRVGLAFAIPQTSRLRGVWRIDASWESQAYSDTAVNGVTPSTFDEARTHASLTVSDWLTPRVRYSVTGGADTWRGRSYSGRTALAGGSLEYRWLDDRIAVSGTATAWAPASFVTSGVRTAYRSSFASQGWVYLADAGVDRASNSAPLATWPGAGDGHSRDLLLRAHPLLESGAIDLDEHSAFGRTVLYTHAEAQRWFAPDRVVRPAIAVFADAAQASRRQQASTVTQFDVGAGLRVKLPGASGALRVDVAHGLRDGADALTVGWQY
jgi:predicted double-glycine peptidase